MYDIVIGIPSRNEADSIRFVTETIDKGLIKHFPKYKAIIVNADNNSKDNTKKVFLSSNTNCDKKYIKTTLNGKGRNVLEIIKYASKVNAKAIALFDADVKTTSSEWIRLLLEPVLIENFDFVTPLYRRNRMEGNTTNHLMYPYLYAIYNQKIQQPIGGEFAMSKKLYVKVINNRKWKSTYLYGIDIMLTTLALKNKMKIKQQFLGRKMHKPSFPKQRLISSTELDTLFHIFLESNKKRFFNTHDEKVLNLVDKEITYPKADWIKESKKESKEYIVKNKELLKKNFPQLKDEFFIKNQFQSYINKQIWAEILASTYKNLNNKNINIYKEEISELLLCRIYKFWRDIEKMTLKQVDKEIQEQTELLKASLSSF